MLERLYRLALGFAGYRVIEARDGLEALALLDADRPDLVVLDLDLPKISGYVVRDELAARCGDTRHPHRCRDRIAR